LNILTVIVHTLQNTTVIESFNHVHSLDALQERVLSVLASPRKKSQESKKDANKFFSGRSL
jgi:hypothetical protein